MKVYNENAVLDVFTANLKMEELNLALEHPSIKKSPRDNNIHGEFLKHIGKVAKETILCVFNIIWVSRLVTVQFKRTVDIPVLKKDKDPKQFHSLLSSIPYQYSWKDNGKVDYK